MKIYTINYKSDNRSAWDGFKQRKSEINEVMKILIANKPELKGKIYIYSEEC